MEKSEGKATTILYIHHLRSKVSEEHDILKKKELESGPKASHGYGGRFGEERDRMNKSAVGHEYVADVEKHSSQTDAARGFGGKYGVERDQADKSAVGFDYKGEVEKHASQKGNVPEAQQELYNTQQEVSELKKLLEEERNRRLSTENRLSLAEEQIKWLTQRERESARTPITGAYGSQETTVLIDIPGISCQVTRSHAGCKRVLCSLCRSRTQMPVLAAIYFLLVHVLFILCITGYL